MHSKIQVRKDRLEGNAVSGSLCGVIAVIILVDARVCVMRVGFLQAMVSRPTLFIRFSQEVLHWIEGEAILRVSR